MKMGLIIKQRLSTLLAASIIATTILPNVGTASAVADSMPTSPPIVIEDSGGEGVRAVPPSITAGAGTPLSWNLLSRLNRGFGSYMFPTLDMPLTKLSEDERYMAFTTYAMDDEQAAGRKVVYIQDRKTAELQLVRTPDSKGTVIYFDMTPDARYIVYTYGEDVVSGITQVYLYDRTTDQLETINGVSGTSEFRYDDGEYVSISADGRYVAFDTDAKLVEQDTNEERDVYLYDRMGSEEKLSRISLPLKETWNNDSWGPSISGDGTIIAFVSRAQLIEEEEAGIGKIYLYNRTDGSLKQVAEGSSPSLSGDGRYVAFTTAQSHMTAGDSNGRDDIYVYDQTEDSYRRVSMQENGSEHASHSRYPSISRDGAYVAYEVRQDSISDPAISYVTGIQDLTSARIAVPESPIKLGASNMRPTVGNGGRTITFFSTYTERISGIEFPYFDYFIATNGAAPVWPAGSSLKASNIGDDHITVSWPEAADPEGVTGYALYVNSKPTAYIPAGASTTYTLTNQPLGTTEEHLIQVEAINSRYQMSMNGPSYTWMREGEENPPPEELVYFEWIGERGSDGGPLQAGSTIVLYAQGAPGREAKVEWTYQEWDGDSEVERTDTLLLKESANSGLYTGSLTITPGTTELSEMKLVMSGEGKVEEQEAEHLPISVGGSLDISFTGVTSAELQGAVLSILQSGAEVRSLTLNGDELESIAGLWPGEDTTIILRTSDYRYEMARLDEVQIQAGRTNSVSVPVTLPAQLRVKAVDAEGKPVEGIPVTLWDSEHEHLDTTSTGHDGATRWHDGLMDGQTITAELNLEGYEYDLAPGTSLSITLDKGDNELLVSLVSPDRGKLELTVLSPENTPVFDAHVTATQTYKGKQVVTSGRTSFDGKVRLDLYAGEATLEAAQPSYQYKADPIQVDVKAETTTKMNIPMVQPKNYVVNLNIFKKALDTEWLGPLNMNNEFFLSTVTSRPAGWWVKTYFSNSVILGGNPGSTVEACVEGTIYGYVRSCGTATMDENSNADVEVRLQEKGARIQGEVELGRNMTYNAAIYELTANGGKKWVADAWDAHFQTYPFNINIPKGGTFRMDVSRNVRDGNYKSHYEFASVEFTIEENQIKHLGKLSFNASSHFANQSGNYLTAHPSRAIPGSMIVMKASYRNNTEFTAEDALLQLEIPDGMTIVSDSLGNLAVTGGSGEATIEAGTLHVPLGDLAKGSSGTVAYKLQVATSFNKASVTAAARIKAKLNSASIEETLGLVHMDTPKVTLDAPAQIADVNRRTVLSGYAPAGSTVNIYDTDVRIGGAVANASGIWMVMVTLADLGNQSTHALWAETEVNGVKLQSEKAYAEYDVNLPQLVRMAYSQAPAGRWISVEVGKNVDDLPYTVWPGNPFLFDLEFTQPDQVENVRVYMDGQDGDSIPAVREGDLFRASVPTTQNALGAIYVDFDVKNQPRIYDGSIPDLEQIRASMPLKMRDFEVVELEAFELSEGKYTGSVVLSFPQLDDTKLHYSITVDPTSDYVPSAEEQELANRSGVPVVQKSYETAETDTSMSIKLGGYIPSDLLLEEEGARKGLSASAAGKPGDWKHTAEYFMEIKADVDGVKGHIDNVKGQYSSYMGYAGKINKIMHNVESSGLDCLAEMPTTAKEAGKALASVILGEVAKTAMSAGVGVMALTGVGGIVAGKVTSMASDRIDKYVDQQIDAVGSGRNECNDDESKKKRGIKVASPKWIYDPSGYVYEAVKSNPLEGVTATVLYQDPQSGEWKVWNAAEYEQVNPQLTDQAGKYGWDVPPGKWKVVWNKAGYESNSSDELVVPPPHTEVNAGLISRTPPQVSAVQGKTFEGGSYLDITFSKYLKVTDLPKGAVVLTDDAQNLLEGTAEFIQVEESAANPDQDLSRTIRFTPKAALSITGAYSVKLGQSLFSSYANVMMLDKDTGPHPLPVEELDLQGPTALEARVESAGRMVRITYNEPVQATADAAKFLLDGTAGVVTSAVAATKQGSNESHELLLTLHTAVTEASQLTLLADAVKDKAGNLSGEATIALTPDLNASLSKLTVGSGTLSPAFNPAHTEYKLTLPAGAKELDITASAAAAEAKLSVGSEPAISGLSKKVVIPEDGIIRIIVNAGGRLAMKTYTIQVSLSGGGGPTPTPTTTPVPTNGSTQNPPITPTPKPADPLNMGESARISPLTSADGKTTLVVDMDTAAVTAALKDGGKAKELYVELKEKSNGVVIQIPAQAITLMKNAEATLLVQTPNMKVRLNAAEALQGEVMADGTSFKLIVGEADGEHLAEAAKRQNKSIKLLTSPVTIHAETIHSNQSTPVQLKLNKHALQVEFVKLTEKTELVDVYRYDTASAAWIYVKSHRHAQGTGLVFDVQSAGPYAVLTISNHQFADMSGHWAKQDVEWMVRRLLVNGTSESEFKPNASITRAEFTAMLMRALRLPMNESTIRTEFDDVDQTDWYHHYVYSAAAKGLVKGRDASHFAPDETITREEMAVIISRAYPLLGLEKPSTGGLDQLEGYSDSSQIHAWARGDVAMVLQEGLVKGITASRFDPAGHATRAQAAAVFKRLLSKLEEQQDL